MIEKIETHVLDLLQADARLYAGGSAYAAGWSGVTRPDDPHDAPKPSLASAGFVNLFDRSYDPDAGNHRPAVYLGTRGFEASDRLDFPSVSSGSRLEYRVLTLPLILTVQVPGGTKRQAKAQRNQLRANVRAILFDHFVEGGYWYELTMPGDAGGSAKEQVWASGSGVGAQGVVEAMATVPVVIRYSWRSSSSP